MDAQMYQPTADDLVMQSRLYELQAVALRAKFVVRFTETLQNTTSLYHPSVIAERVFAALGKEVHL